MDSTEKSQHRTDDLWTELFLDRIRSQGFPKIPENFLANLQRLTFAMTSSYSVTLPRTRCQAVKVGHRPPVASPSCTFSDGLCPLYLLANSIDETKTTESIVAEKAVNRLNSEFPNSRRRTQGFPDDSFS